MSFSFNFLWRTSTLACRKSFFKDSKETRLTGNFQDWKAIRWGEMKRYGKINTKCQMVWGREKRQGRITGQGRGLIMREIEKEGREGCSQWGDLYSTRNSCLGLKCYKLRQTDTSILSGRTKTHRLKTRDSNEKLHYAGASLVILIQVTDTKSFFFYPSV